MEKFGWKCAITGEKTNLELHHIDPIWNNPIRATDKENIIVLCKKAHRKIHATHSEIKFKQWLESGKLASDFVVDGYTLPSIIKKPTSTGNKLVRKFKKILSIRYCGEQDVYDIEVIGPYHNFVADGVVVHNSRAIPVAKMIEQVENDPFMQLKVGKNIAGMQAKEYLEGQEFESFQDEWKKSAKMMAEQARIMNSMGVHKQSINRILEPWQIMQTVLTATDFENFFELRIHSDAEPHINALAMCMKAAMDSSIPILRNDITDWHLPYINEQERKEYPIETLLACSTARCARVSYLTHEGKIPVIEKDLELYERLVGSRPLHASPCEHQAYPSPNPQMNKNFNGWIQHRELVERSIWGKNQ